MRNKILLLLLCEIAAIGVSLALSSAAMAAPEIVLPGPADVGRMKPQENVTPPDHSKDQQITVPEAPVRNVSEPAGANAIFFTLKAVNIEGMTAFTPRQMADIYAPFIGKEVPLDIAWIVAESITDRYHAAGYFLSRAYVPQQSIQEGAITIRVLEGYVGRVNLPSNAGTYRVVQEYIGLLVSQKPVTSDAVERFLLSLNDLPGYSFRAVLAPIEDKNENDPAVELVMEAATKDNRGSVSFDNFSSRYLGPNEFTASYSASVLPLQQTTVTGLSAMPADKLRYGTIDHTVAIAPDTSLEVTGGVTKAYPGYTLEPEEIDSLARSETLGLNYQWIRQRDENLSLKAIFDSEDISSDVLDTPLMRDHIRALRAIATYDTSDAWHGNNIAMVTVSHGLDDFGASQKDDADLSRAGAIPDFTKANLSLSRLQGIDDEWSLYMASTGQWTSNILYSSEEFGYGGQAFGRAYDTSTITGDKGVAGSLEMRYSGLSSWDPAINPQPYAFYDIGKVWSEAVGQPGKLGSSAGFGFRFTTPWHQTGNIGLAWPISRDNTPPIYGEGDHHPRLLLQVTQEFK